MFLDLLLSLLIWTPIVGGVLVLWTGDDRTPDPTRWVALLFALLTLLLCVPLYLNFDPQSWQMQFVEDHTWIPSLNVRYSLGVDGISALFLMLSSFTNLLVILAAWRSIKVKIAQYMAIFLISTGIMNGAFCAMDSILFYTFWEASLIPMFLGIGVWGGKLRGEAAVKFFLYTLLGSMFMLLGLIYLGIQAHSLSIVDFQSLQLTHREQILLFLAFLSAFAVKIPMWPVHTWLPDVHTEAPAGGSVVLAALMLKMGAYGFIRFSLPIVPVIQNAYQMPLIILSLIAIVSVGFACIAQKDMKRLIAYSSISHMGMVTLALFMVFLIVVKTQDIDDATMAIQGAMFQMIAHAFSSGGLFLGVSYLYLRCSSRLMDGYRGIAHRMPIFAAFFMLFALANIGLPGTSGFVGEFMVILAIFKASPAIAAIAALTLILAPAYTLWMYKRVFFGELLPGEVSEVQDLNVLEILIFVLLAVPVILLGLFPQVILNISEASTTHFIQMMLQKV